MTNQMFASIYIGSYEVTLKVFEFNTKKKVYPVDFIRSRVDLGREIFRNKTIGYEQVDDLCIILNEFKQIMASYKVTDYRIFAPVLYRDIKNSSFVMDQILIRTGFCINILNNSEHRFISYKAVAGQPAFEKLIKTSSAIVEVGASSVQITLFEKGSLVTTQRIEVGSMRISSLLNKPGVTQSHYQREIEEFINKKFDVYKSLYLQDLEVDSLIFISDYGMDLLKGMERDTGKSKEIMEADRLKTYLTHLQAMPLHQIARALNLSDEKDPLILPTIMLYASLVDHLTPKTVWFPGVDISDGIAYDFAQEKGIVKASHDFEADIISAAHHLSEHYNSYSPHIDEIVAMSMRLFDTLKKVHGLGKRERLLLQVAGILHDCGKYISFSYSARCAYQVILSSEIIGLTHKEREIIARTVLYLSEEMDPYQEVSDALDMDSYLVTAKLSAILRVANALDQSHRQKFENLRIVLKDRLLIISVEAYEDMELEQVLFESKTAYFENVFSIKPVLKEKRVYKLNTKKKDK